MVDLDSDPTKLLDIIEIGKQLLITRGSLTTFSIANDVAKYFAIIPAMFVAVFPSLDTLNIMKLSNPHSAILSAVIFNALVIVALIPLALRGVKFQPRSGAEILRRNLCLRRRRPDRPVHLHQADRHRPHRHGSALMRQNLRQLLVSLRRSWCSRWCSACCTRPRCSRWPGRLQGQGQRLDRRGRRASGRLVDARPGLRRPEVLLAAAVGGRRRLRRQRLRRRRLGRVERRPDVGQAAVALPAGTRGRRHREPGDRLRRQPRRRDEPGRLTGVQHRDGPPADRRLPAGQRLDRRRPRAGRRRHRVVLRPRSPRSRSPTPGFRRHGWRTLEA